MTTSELYIISDEPHPVLWRNVLGYAELAVDPDNHTMTCNSCDAAGRRTRGKLNICPACGVKVKDAAKDSESVIKCECGRYLYVCNCHNQTVVGAMMGLGMEIAKASVTTDDTI